MSKSRKILIIEPFYASSHKVMEDQGDLYQKLKMMIQAWSNQLPSLSDHVEHYDWSNIIESYDQKFEEIIKQQP